jgi:hypothetical protein
MIACLSDDVHFVNRSGGDVSAETHGIEEFRMLAAQAVTIFKERKQTITNSIVCDQHVTLDINYRATIAIDLPNGWKAGQDISLRGVSLFSLSNGKIVELVDIS